MKITGGIAAVLLLVGMVGCRAAGDSNFLKSSSGKPYEVLTVMDDERWNGAVGDTLRSILWEPFPWVNQYEPLYSLYHNNGRRFRGMVQQYRNILIYRVNPQFTEPAMTAEYDKWSKPQIVVYIDGPSDGANMTYMDIHRDALQQIFDLEEQKRFTRSAKEHGNREIHEKVLADFGVDIDIPVGYSIRSEHPDFIWISYEPRMVSQGIVIYKYPLVSRRTFTPEYQVEKRNEFMRLIPGPSAPEVDSYMITSDVVLPEMVRTEFGERVWFRAQGFWDVHNDFMGGPFTSYSTVDATTRQVVTIDTYVYSPRYDKRQYVRQLQSIAQTATLPGDTVKVVNFSELPEE